MKNIFFDFCLLAEAYEKVRNPTVNSGYSYSNLSKIDVERILSHIICEYPNVSSDEELWKLVIEAAKVPKKKEYRLYDGLVEWVRQIISNSNVTGADIDNISEDDCFKWLLYIFDNYDFTGDGTLLDGVALLMSTPANFTSEEYRCHA